MASGQRVSPNAIVVGAPRCGTTSLYHYLGQHPEVYCPAKKEPKYFSSQAMKLPHSGPGDAYVDEERVRSSTAYYDLYRGGSSLAIRVDGSSEYFVMGRECAKLMRDELGDVPIIIMLRDPAKRAMSAYNNMKRDRREEDGLDAAFASEQARRRDNWDTMWWYSDASMYFERLLDYQEHFSQVLVLCFEQFREDPLRSMVAVEAFLGLPPFDAYDFSTAYAKSGRPRGALAGWLLNRQNPLAYKIRALAKRFIPRSITEAVAGRLVERSGEGAREWALLNSLWPRFAEDSQKVDGAVSFEVQAHWGPAAWGGEQAGELEKEDGRTRLAGANVGSGGVQ